MRTRFALLLLLACGMARAEPVQQFAQLGDLKLENQSVIEHCSLGYRTLGSLNAARSNAIVFLSWHTGTSGEALSMLGQKGLFDPAPYFVVLIDALGNGVSCSPSNSATQRGPAFPVFTIRDMVESEYRLLTETLKLEHVHAVMGFSMGGMQTFQWMVSHPDFMDVAIPLAGTPRQTSYDKLFWRTEEMAMLSDPDYANGHYLKNPGLATYRLLLSMQITTPAYRMARTTPAAFDAFFQKSIAADPDAADANDSRWQIRAMLAQDIGESAAHGSERTLELAAKKVRARVHIVNALQDHMVNPNPALDFAKLLHADTTLLKGDCGHVAVNCEMELIRPAVEAALKALP
ncbi:homoserine O-acetyltransferase [Oxalobacteraceae bacterium GrIS 1.11]